MTALQLNAEFFAKIEKSEKQFDEGKFTTLLPGENVLDMLKRCGYEPLEQTNNG
ncbi:MAG: hypothetical protein II956_13925 [Bacteroidales bacterium]|nr:hypothetical protein [Bacteroidales bacterium]